MVLDNHQPEQSAIPPASKGHFGELVNFPTPRTARLAECLVGFFLNEEYGHHQCRSPSGPRRIRECDRRKEDKREDVQRLRQQVQIPQIPKGFLSLPS